MLRGIHESRVVAQAKGVAEREEGGHGSVGSVESMERVESMESNGPGNGAVVVLELFLTALGREID
jgi:hypothetical protein